MPLTTFVWSVSHFCWLSDFLSLLQCCQPYDSWVISSPLYTELIEYSDSTEYKLPSKWTNFFLSWLLRGKGRNLGFPNLKLIQSLQCCALEQQSWLIVLKTIALRGVKWPVLPYSFYSLFYVRKVAERGWYETQDQHCWNKVYAVRGGRSRIDTKPSGRQGKKRKDPEKSTVFHWQQRMVLL